MANKRGDGVFIAAVLVLSAMLLTVIGYGGLGGQRYGTLAISLLMGAGGVSYFGLKGSEEFGMRMKEGALMNAAVALVGALAFTVLLMRNSEVLSSIAAAVALACAVPLAAILVRSRGGAVSA